MIIFNNPLTKSYQDPNQFEGNSACIYEFYKPNDYPSLFIGLIKYSSKENTADQFHQFRVSHHDTWGIDSELLLYLGDSALSGGKMLVTENPEYIRKGLPKYIPQFFVMKWYCSNWKPQQDVCTAIEENFPH